MSTYENAPATKMVATHCAVCSRPLCDAKSVELGIGPECRKKHGYDTPDVAVDLVAACEVAQLTMAWPGRAEANAALIADVATTRELANRIVYQIAAHQDGEHVADLCRALARIGFVKLAARIENRIAQIEIVDDKDLAELGVRSPYNVVFVEHARKIGGFWVKETKSWHFARKDRRALWELLQKSYAGRWARGPKGLFRIAPVTTNVKEAA